MKKNFKLIIEYDGSYFSGWQKQKDQKTVQGEIEKFLSLMLNTDIKIFGSGRTDAGVHAWNQVANFHADTTLMPYHIKKGLNSLIKHPIVIKKCTIEADQFHARYCAVSKEYHYVILNQKDPCAIGRLYHWHIRAPLDLNAMKLCCQAVTGTLDFKSFENTGSPRSSSIRNVFFADMTKMKNNRLVFKICATGFLKYMVRNLIGTIVLAGSNKICVDEFIKILKAKDRTKAGTTAPPHGLFLDRVHYS